MWTSSLLYKVVKHLQQKYQDQGYKTVCSRIWKGQLLISQTSVEINIHCIALKKTLAWDVFCLPFVLRTETESPPPKETLTPFIDVLECFHVNIVASTSSDYCLWFAFWVTLRHRHGIDLFTVTIRFWEIFNLENSTELFTYEVWFPKKSFEDFTCKLLWKTHQSFCKDTSIRLTPTRVWDPGATAKPWSLICGGSPWWCSWIWWEKTQTKLQQHHKI